MSYIAFVKIIGSLNVYFRFNSCLISARVLIVTLLYYYLLGGEVVIRSPHDPEVPSSNPGKNNTSDFSIRDPLSLSSCDWYRIYLAMWWNSSVGRAADLTYTCQVRCHGFDSRCFPHI